MEKILKMTPVVSVLILISGILNLSVYYFQFQIKITDFLEWTEIFTLFMYDLIEFLIISCVVAAMIISDEIKEKIKTGVQNYPESILALYRLPKFWNIFLLIPTLVVLSSLGGYGALFWIYVILLMLLMRFSFAFSDFIRDESKGYIEKTTYYIIVIFILLNVYKIPSNLYRGLEKRRNPTVRNVSLDIDGRHISPYSGEYYIGKTDHYVFIYNQTKGQTLIYPIDKLNILKYHTLNKTMQPEDYSFKSIMSKIMTDFTNN